MIQSYPYYMYTIKALTQTDRAAGAGAVRGTWAVGDGAHP